MLVTLSSLGLAAPQNEADIAYLQNGVREIAPTYESSSLVVFGEQAFPVVTGRPKWGVIEPTGGVLYAPIFPPPWSDE
jgi:hypothetical protein